MTIPSLSQSTTHPLTGGGKSGGEITQKPITFFLRHPVSKVESVALSVVLERRRFPSLGVTILSDLPNHVLPLGPRNHLGKLLKFLELLPQPRTPAVILPSDQVPAVAGAGAEAAEAKTAAAARRRNGVVLVVESPCGAAFAGGFSYG
nr:hypothetical protein Itr_chr02CG19050 [Ipomoea trifida]